MSLSLEVMAWTQAGLALACGVFGVFGFKGPDLLLSPRMASAHPQCRHLLCQGLRFWNWEGGEARPHRGHKQEETELGFGLHLYSFATSLTPAAEEEGEKSPLSMYPTKINFEKLFTFIHI